MPDNLRTRTHLFYIGKSFSATDAERDDTTHAYMHNKQTNTQPFQQTHRNRQFGFVTDLKLWSVSNVMSTTKIG